jgi:hypothetical protein
MNIGQTNLTNLKNLNRVTNNLLKISSEDWWDKSLIVEQKKHNSLKNFFLDGNVLEIIKYNKNNNKNNNNNYSNYYSPVKYIIEIGLAKHENNIFYVVRLRKPYEIKSSLGNKEGLKRTVLNYTNKSIQSIFEGSSIPRLIDFVKDIIVNNK